MRAYYFDNIIGDQRLLHDSGRPIDPAYLRKIGVLYWTIPVNTAGGYEAEIDKIAEQQGYKNRDTINVTKEGLGDLYESKLESFFDEWVPNCLMMRRCFLTQLDRHMHEDEEIRYILSGSGFFDVRGK